MAAAVAFPPADPGDVIPLDPNEIELGERLRPIDTAWATAIGQSMKRDGQIHTVDVRRVGNAWQLAGAGGHRVTGARLAGIAIDVRVVLFDEDSSRRREAAENLFRRANDPLERAEAIAELVRLQRERAGIDEVERRDARIH
jgi:ParB family chromosome partitioning protein